MICKHCGEFIDKVGQEIRKPLSVVNKVAVVFYQFMKVGFTVLTISYQIVGFFQSLNWILTKADEQDLRLL